MSYQIRYSTRAYAEYEEILDYIVKNFGLKVAAKVDMHFEEVINQICINPNLFPYSDKMDKLRRCVISPQTTIYYRFNGEYVELASFRGSRMNPDSLEL